jgi:hypothetical protein
LEGSFAIVNLQNVLDSFKSHKVEIQNYVRKANDMKVFGEINDVQHDN